MKILTKILNVLVIIFVVIGIVSTVYSVRGYLKPQIDYYQIVDSLQSELSSKYLQLKLTSDSINEIRQLRIADQEKYNQDKKNLIQSFTSNQEKVKGLPLTEMVQYILDYFGSTEAEIIQKGDTVLVIMSPNLVNAIGTDLAVHRDNLEKLQAVEIVLQSADNLIKKFNQEVTLLERKISTQENIINNLSEQNELKDETIKSKDKEIRKYKIQRVLIVGGSVLGFVLIVL